MKKIYITIIALLIINFVQGQDFYFDLNKSYENKVSIYNNADKKVGYISVISLRVNYYDVNNKLVKSEKSNNTITIKNFMEVTKKGTIEITENRLKAGIRKWNVVSDSFDIFDNNDEKIGVYFFDGNGVWKYKEEINYKNSDNYSITFKEKRNDFDKQGAITYKDFTSRNSNSTVSNSTSSTQTTNYSYSRKKNKSSFIFPNGDGLLYLGTSMMDARESKFDNSENMTIPQTRFELGYFDYSKNYFGIQFGTQKSNTNTDYNDLKDQIYAFTYGRGIISSTLFIKIGLGYHFYNYPTVESFGDFYDIGEGFYGNVGLKLVVLNLGFAKIIGEYNIDSKGLNSYGFGIGLNL